MNNTLSLSFSFAEKYMFPGVLAFNWLSYCCEVRHCESQWFHVLFKFSPLYFEWLVTFSYRHVLILLACVFRFVARTLLLWCMWSIGVRSTSRASHWGAQISLMLKWLVAKTYHVICLFFLFSEFWYDFRSCPEYSCLKENRYIT